ncbi:hypothetical protein [Actinoplanes sp. NPDC049265]|uniref:hypothetical protein n=1 Tax=Actinoplanes sp. NPDC049265 TaxID=3363902 RepID=UPI0037161470
MPAARRVALAGLLLLAGCGDLPAASAQGIAGNDLVAEMVTQLDASATLTYTAGYHLAGGATATVTQAQKPLRQGYDYPGGRLVQTTASVTDCRAKACTLTGPPPAGALPPALDAVRAAGLVPTPVVRQLLNAAALDQAVTVASRDTTIAGHHATCLDLTGVDNAPARDFSTCVTNDGVLGSFRGTVSGTAIDMTMTEYDPSASYSAFTPPPGATVT